MFCDGCGNAMSDNQRYCPNCGKEVGGPPPLMPPARSRLAGHIRMLGILWLAASAFRVLGALLVGFTARIWMPHAPFEMQAPLAGVIGLAALLIGASGAAGFLAGWGLLEHKPWSRTLAIVLGVLSLFDLPFGTALGIYTLWVLLPSSNEEEFRRLRRAA
jgi:hypothetical protein